MLTQILCAILFIIVSIILRFVFYRTPIDKVKAGWISFALAVFATAVCTLMSGSQQNTAITGFATMLVCYNVLSYKVKL